MNTLLNSLAWQSRHLEQPNRKTEEEACLGPPHLLCYCFDYTDEDIAVDLATNHRSTILPAITAEIRAGNCACETKNPSGKCCLGDVKTAIQECGQESEESI